MTIQAVADTHALIWYVFADSRISSVARAMMQDVAKTDDQIGVSSISLVELV
jgi:PIN domain nuclease of toxin-antitoxin system